MTRKIRVLAVFVIVEAVLIGLWWYLARYGAMNPDQVAADFQPALGQTMGMVMGGFAGLSLLFFFLAARNDRTRR